MVYQSLHSRQYRLRFHLLNAGGTISLWQTATRSKNLLLRTRERTFYNGVYDVDGCRAGGRRQEAGGRRGRWESGVKVIGSTSEAGVNDFRRRQQSDVRN